MTFLFEVIKRQLGILVAQAVTLAVMPSCRLVEEFGDRKLGHTSCGRHFSDWEKKLTRYLRESIEVFVRKNLLVQTGY